MAMAIVHGYIHPYNNNLINFQELVLLFNYLVLCFLMLFNESELLNIIAVNVLVGASFIQFLLILAYHAFAFVNTGHC